MVKIFLIKNDPNGDPLFKFEVTNIQNGNIRPDWPVTPAPLPEEGSDQNVLVKLTGNILQSGVTWTLKNYDTNQEVLAGIPTKTVQQQINFFTNTFQPQSIEDSFQIIFEYDTDPIVFNGFIPSVQFTMSQPNNLTWTAVAKFIQGTVVAVYELDSATAPLNVVVISPAAGQIQVNWSTPATAGSNPITGYRVQYAILGGGFVNVDLGVVLTTTISSLTTGTYNVRVLAKTDIGLGRPSILKEIVVA